MVQGISTKPSPKTKVYVPKENDPPSICFLSFLLLFLFSSFPNAMQVCEFAYVEMERPAVLVL